MKVYLAASFSRQEEMKDVARRIPYVTIVSRWLHENQEMKQGNCRKKYMRDCAFTDLNDVKNADLVVRFTDNLSQETIPSHLGTGARHFEVGYAFALGKPVIVVGGHQNVFDFLPNVAHLPDTEALIRYLSPQENE